MQEPIRLRHDPAEPVALRQALESEFNAPLAHDLGALRAGLMHEVASAGPATLGQGLSAGGLALLVALAAASAVWMTRAVEPTLTAAPTPNLALAPPPIPTLPRAVAPEPASPPGASPESAAIPALDAARPEPRPAHRPRPDRAAPAPQPAKSRLAEEMAAYELAQAALTDGQYREAAERFAGYLHAYPDGALVNEATLSRLEALHRAERPAEVAQLARQVLQDGLLVSRRAEVLRVLAEAEVMRGHCAEAETAFEQAGEAGAKLEATVVQSALQACEGRAMR